MFKLSVAIVVPLQAKMAADEVLMVFKKNKIIKKTVQIHSYGTRLKATNSSTDSHCENETKA